MFRRLVLIFCYLVIFFSFQNLSAQEIITLENNGDVESIGKQLFVLEDKTGLLKVQDIISRSSEFKKSTQENPLFGITHSAVWMKFTVKNIGSEDHYLEIGNPIIDTVNLYYTNSDGIIQEIKSGESFRAADEELENPLLLFKLPMNQNEEKTFYLKIQSINSLQCPVHIGTLKGFFRKNNQRDLYHGIYYGFILLILLFNVFLLFSTKDESYFYYILYVLFIGLFIAHVNGHAFNYLWKHIGWHRNLTIVLVSGVGVFASMFASNFLQTRTRHPRLHKFFYFLWFIYFIDLIIRLIGFRHLSTAIVLVVSFFATLFVLGTSIYVFIKGYKPAKFFIMAFAVFGIGTIAVLLKNMGLLPYNIFTNYAIQIGSGIEMILFSMALADKINIYKKEKEEAQKQVMQSQLEIIRQLQEKEQLKDQLNKELEKKVQERTYELEEKNKQLDSFVYKASHDIKGPLKSVIGLTTIGMKDVKDTTALSYFDHIYKSTIRLDKILAELLSFTKAKEHKLEKSLIDFSSILTNVLSSFEHAPGYEQMNFNIDKDEIINFYSDEKSVYSIIQNMVENAIKYRDPQKNTCSLCIIIKVSNDNVTMSFKDNGLGIDSNSLNRIFDMFYKVNESSVGTGLGLYITKTSIEKLGGKIEAESMVGEGTIFKIVLPNSK
jgi:hypothetical protein